MKGLKKFTGKVSMGFGSSSHKSTGQRIQRKRMGKVGGKQSFGFGKY